MPTEQRRVAERILIVPELEGTLAENPGRIGEIATLGCRFEHVPRLAIGTTLPLSFRWEGLQIALPTKIVWSELKLAGSEKFYHSGLQFGDATREALDTLRTALAKHVKRILTALFPELPLEQTRKPSAISIPFMSTPFLSVAEPPPETQAVKPGGYLELRLRNGRWDRTETPAVSQPRDGLSFPDDYDPGEIAIWLQCYQDAAEPVRRMLRAALELRIGESG